MRFPEYFKEGYGTENLGPFLASLIRLVRPKRILEVGIGYTTPFIAEAIEENLGKIYTDGCHNPEYYLAPYEPKYILIDDGSLESRKIPDKNFISFINGKFQALESWLEIHYGKFDFVWFDCGDLSDYEYFLKNYWNLCSEYIFLHNTYEHGKPNDISNLLSENIKSRCMRMDIVEPNKYRQGSVTMLKKI